MLDRDAALAPACEVMRVPLSTLCLCGAMSLCISSAFLRRMLFALAVFLRSAPVVAVRGGLGGARGGGGAVLLGGGGEGSSLTSVASGVISSFLRTGSSRAYMLSFACVLERVGYDRLLRDEFLISGTMAMLCDWPDRDDDDVRRTRSSPVSSSLDADERVLRRCLSLLRGLLRSRSGSFLLLRRLCASDELILSMGGVKVARDGGWRLIQSSIGYVVARCAYKEADAPFMGARCVRRADCPAVPKVSELAAVRSVRLRGCRLCFVGLGWSGVPALEVTWIASHCGREPCLTNFTHALHMHI